MGDEQLPSIFMFPDIWYGLERMVDMEGAATGVEFPRIPQDVDFLLSLYKKYSPHPVRSIIECCCGDAPHGRLLAKRGYRIIGYDYSKPMVEIAARKAEKEGVKMELFVRDSEDFTLPMGDIDAACVLTETQPCGFSAKNGFEYNQAMVNHLRCIAKVLKPGAIYVQDWGHTLGGGRDMSPALEPALVSDRVFELQHATVRRRLSNPPDDVYGNLHILRQECEISYKKDGRRVRTLDNFREPFVYPLPYHAALAELSGYFHLLGAHQHGNLESGYGKAGNPVVWVALQRTNRA